MSRGFNSMKKSKRLREEEDSVFLPLNEIEKYGFSLWKDGVWKSFFFID